jgi:ABC-type bacteriocin/lantibiotic exporter with double-glycine peptidase domain
MAGLDVRDLRRNIGVVTQDPYMFGRSIRANIALSDPDLDMQQVTAAAQLAGIHEDLVTLPMGYDTILADGGASMSGGQCQRLALARALVRRPRVLLLDEATSALDTVKEAEVMDNIARIRSTRIVIAHRLSTVAAADIILVMDKGQIAEYGTHAQLMQTGRIYQELVGAQTKYGSGSSHVTH